MNTNSINEFINTENQENLAKYLISAFELRDDIVDKTVLNEQIC